jgi:hypothetical protein
VDESANTPRDPRHEPGATDSGDSSSGRTDLQPNEEPVLDPTVEDHVRTLLANAPDPGPMPSAVTGRIASALADESRLRLARGPLAGQDPDADVLAPLIRQRQRPTPWLAVAAVAAAAAVVAVGGSALHLSKDTHTSPAAIVAGTSTVGSTPGPTSSPAAASAVHVQQSGTDYEPTAFPAQVRALLAHPGAELTDRQTLAPALGPVATSEGLTSCLEALGEFPSYRVTADLGLYDGAPAAIIAVTRDSRTTAYAVGRDCQPGDAMILRDATTIP